MNVIVSMVCSAAQRVEEVGRKTPSFPTQHNDFVWVSWWSASGASAATLQCVRRHVLKPLGGLFGTVVHAGSLCWHANREHRFRTALALRTPVLGFVRATLATHHWSGQRYLEQPGI